MERFSFARIRVLYSDIDSLPKVNSSLCAPFRVHRGLWQGCTLSGMLYALSLEPLLTVKLRLAVRGLLLPGFTKCVVLSAYADDLVVFIRDQQDVAALTHIASRFSAVSATRIKWGKSEALAVGGWPGGLPVLPGRLTWKTNGLKYLGIYLGSDNTMTSNWEGMIEKVKGKLTKWRWIHSHMSYRGRVLVLNILVASLLWHRHRPGF